jgi:anti-sigma regulatory factor (Ser/Thr protein kinase)
VRVADFTVAVQYALANAVLHDCNSNPKLHIRMKVFSDPSGVSIIIQDQWPGFDVSKVPDPTSKLLMVVEFK